MKPALRQLCCLLLLSLAVLVTESNAKTGKPVASPPPIDFSELDKLVVEELKEKNTPGAVITVVSGDQVVYQKAFGVANGVPWRRSTTTHHNATAAPPSRPTSKPSRTGEWVSACMQTSW